MSRGDGRPMPILERGNGGKKAPGQLERNIPENLNVPEFISGTGISMNNHRHEATASPDSRANTTSNNSNSNNNNNTS